jgi:hypothetical protein
MLSVGLFIHMRSHLWPNQGAEDSSVQLPLCMNRCPFLCHPERSASQTDRVTQCLWRGVEEPVTFSISSCFLHIEPAVSQGTPQIVILSGAPHRWIVRLRAYARSRRTSLVLHLPTAARSFSTTGPLWFFLGAGRRLHRHSRQPYKHALHWRYQQPVSTSSHDQSRVYP